MANPVYPLLLEQTVNLLTTQMQTNFATVTQEIDNQYQDGISIETVDPDNIHISVLVQPTRMPAAFILASTMAFEYTDNPNYLIAEDEVIVLVSTEEVGAEQVQRKAWRYQRVLMELFNLVDLQTADGRLKLKCVPRRTGTTEPVKTKLVEFGQKYRMDAVLEMRVQHFEKTLF